MRDITYSTCIALSLKYRGHRLYRQRTTPCVPIVKRVENLGYFDSSDSVYLFRFVLCNKERKAVRDASCRLRSSSAVCVTISCRAVTSRSRGIKPMTNRKSSTVSIEDGTVPCGGGWRLAGPMRAESEPEIILQSLLEHGTG